MLAGIKEVLIISTTQDSPNFQRLFGDGSHLGIRLSYKEQPSPDGLSMCLLGKLGFNVVTQQSVYVF